MPAPDEGPWHLSDTVPEDQQGDDDDATAEGDRQMGAEDYHAGAIKPGGVNQLIQAQVIEVVGECRGDHNGCESDCSNNLYRTLRPAYDALQERLEDITLLDCGHRPVRTIDPEEGIYTCRVPDDVCDARYTREEIEEVLDA